MATNWVDISTGIQSRKLDTGYYHVRVHYSADPEKDASWVRRHSAQYGGVESPRWRREFEIDYNAIQGQPVYPMLCGEHLVMNLPSDLTVYRVMDHGIRHPMVCIWVGVNKNGDRHVFREYFRSGATIEVNCAEVLRLSQEKVAATYIDPAVRQRVPMGQKDNQPVSILSIYNKCLDKLLKLADNSRVGYDTVRSGLLSTLARRVLRDGYIDEGSEFCKTYFKAYQLTSYELEQLAAKPSLTFDPSCVRTFREMRNLRFRDTSGDPTTKALPEEVIDFEDDGPDVVRYAMQSKLTYGYTGGYEIKSPFREREQRRIKESNPRYVKRN